MIIAALLTPVFLIVSFFIGLLPEMGSLPTWIDDLLTVVGYGLKLFPVDVWVFAISSVVFWRFGLIVWACIEWVYKKIPGVN